MGLGRGPGESLCVARLGLGGRLGAGWASQTPAVWTENPLTGTNGNSTTVYRSSSSLVPLLIGSD